MAALAARLGARRALVISGPSRRFVEPALAAFPGAEVFDGARVHVPADVVAQVASVAASLTDRTAAFVAARDVLRAIEDLLLHPRALVAREHAARAASACAAAFDAGKPGAQHALAHLLGGALGLDHAPLHA